MDEPFAQAAPAGAGEPVFHPVEPGYKNVLRVRLLAFWGPLTIAAIALDQTLNETVLRGLPTVLVPLLAVISLAMVPQRIYRRLTYAHV